MRICNIYFFEGYIQVAPTIYNLSQFLFKNGYRVNVFITKTSFPLPNFNNTNISIIISDEYLVKNSDNETWTLFERYIKGTLHFVKDNYTQFEGNEIISIGVDYKGGVAAYFFSSLYNTQFLYLSLEINTLQHYHPSKDFEIEVERIIISKAVSVIIQDTDRLNSLSEYINYSPSSVIFLPNSPIELNQTDSSENYFRQLLNIDDKFKYIVLYPGMINDKVYTRELTAAFNFIQSNEFALVLHEREKKEYIEIIPHITTNNRNLFLSLSPLPIEQINTIFKSCDIGVVSYFPFDENFAQIAKASGKLPNFLKFGKPVITNYLDSFNKLIEKYKCGIVIRDFTNIDEWNYALNEIIMNYYEYSENAKKCYALEYSPEVPLNDILQVIDQNSTIFHINSTEVALSWQFYQSSLNFCFQMAEQKEILIQKENLIKSIRASLSYRIGNRIVNLFNFFRRK